MNDHQDPNDPSGLPEPVRKLLEAQQRQNNLKTAVLGIINTRSDAIEEEALVDLWRDLGDQTETYWSAMLAVQGFVTGHDAVMKSLTPLPPLVAARCMEAMAKVMAAHSRALREIEAKKQELASAPPQP